MKFKVYEVKVIQFKESISLEKSFLYVNYFDAVNRFKECIKEAKQIDWIKEGLQDGSDKYQLVNKVDYWKFCYCDEALDYDISIKEREVY